MVVMLSSMTGTLCLQSLKHLLTGPLPKKLADPHSRKVTPSENKAKPIVVIYLNAVVQSLGLIMSFLGIQMN